MPGRSSARSAFAGRTTGRAGIALAVLPAPALASRFATATSEGSEYFLLLFLLLGYALLTHLLMLAAQFRRTWLTLVHLLLGVVSPFLLHAAWSTSRAAYMLSDMLWLLWASAGVLLVPLLLVPPLLQWYGYLEGNPQCTPKPAWALVVALYLTGAALLGWGATH